MKQFQHTKIICTIGPSCCTPETIKKLVHEGMSIARLNFSHRGPNFSNLQKTIDNLNKIRAETNSIFGIALDTKGPEVRIGNFKNGYINVNKNDILNFKCQRKYSDKIEVNENIMNNTNEMDLEIKKVELKLENSDIKDSDETININFSNLEELYIDYIFSLDDGFLKIKIVDIDLKKRVVKGKALNSHKLLSSKSANFPGISLGVPFLSEADQEDIFFGLKNNVDFIFASFVGSKNDLIELKKFINEKKENNKNMPQIISKIESKDGISNLDDIINNCDGIMVARGDLGAEFDLSDILVLQKIISKKCLEKDVPFIIATQMIESMKKCLVPTRAEISDVGNAVLDGADCVMTSAETASGLYPAEVVRMMKSICVKTEKYLRIFSFKSEDKKMSSFNYIKSFISTGKSNQNSINENKGELVVCFCDLNYENKLDTKDVKFHTSEDVNHSYIKIPSKIGAIIDDLSYIFQKLAPEQEVIMKEKINNKYTMCTFLPFFETKNENVENELSDIYFPAVKSNELAKTNVLNSKSQESDINYYETKSEYTKKPFTLKTFLDHKPTDTKKDKELGLCKKLACFVIFTDSIKDLLYFKRKFLNYIPVIVLSTNDLFLRKVTLFKGIFPRKIYFDESKTVNENRFEDEMVEIVINEIKNEFELSNDYGYIVIKRQEK